MLQYLEICLSALTPSAQTPLMSQVTSQVDQVVVIMKDNVDKEKWILSISCNPSD